MPVQIKRNPVKIVWLQSHSIAIAGITEFYISVNHAGMTLLKYSLTTNVKLAIKKRLQTLISSRSPLK